MLTNFIYAHISIFVLILAFFIRAFTVYLLFYCYMLFSDIFMDRDDRLMVLILSLLSIITLIMVLILSLLSIITLM